jgi:hypothetical protein
MNAASESKSHPRLQHALAGLQAGVAGSVIMLVWLTVGSFWVRRSAWLVPNLLSTTFYGSDAYTGRFTHASWVGLALIVAIYGILGMVWGLVWPAERRAWRRIAGMLFGLLAYFLLFDFVWKHVNPLVTLYAPTRELQAGHLLWGLTLARTPVFSRRIAAGSASDPPSEGDQVQEVRTGEVIR